MITLRLTLSLGLHKTWLDYTLYVYAKVHQFTYLFAQDITRKDRFKYNPLPTNDDRTIP